MVRDNKDLTVEEAQKVIDENESVNGTVGEEEPEETPVIEEDIDNADR